MTPQELMQELTCSTRQLTEAVERISKLSHLLEHGEPVTVAERLASLERTVETLRDRLASQEHHHQALLKKHNTLNRNVTIMRNMADVAHADFE